MTWATPLTSSGGSLTVISSTAGGMLILGASNAYTGPTTVSGGTLQLGTAGALPTNNELTVNTNGVVDLNTDSATVDSLNGGGTITSVAGPAPLTIGNANGGGTFSGAIAGQISLTKAGSGTEVLSGNNTYSGVTYINSGVLNLGSSGAIPASGANGITFGGGTMQFTSASNTTDYSYPANIINSTGPISIDTNGTNATFAGVLNSTNTAGLTKIGAGSLTLGGSNSYGGTTTLSLGGLFLANNSAISTGQLTINGGSLDNTSGLAMTLPNNPQAWNSSFTFLGSSSLNMGTGTVGLANNPTVTVSGNTLTVGGAMSGASALTKAGAGTLILGGSNSFNGNTTISGGVLQLAGSYAAQNSTVSVGTTNGLTFAPGIGTFTLGGLSGGSNFVIGDTSGGTGVTLAVGNDGANTTYLGVMSGSGGLTKLGSGNFTLTGVNTVSGPINVSNGTLTMSGAGYVGSNGGRSMLPRSMSPPGAAIVISNTASNFNSIGYGGSETWTVAGLINVTGTDVLSLPYGSSGVTLNSGTLQGGSGNVTYGNFYAASAGTLINATGNSSISGGNVGIQSGSILTLNTTNPTDQLSVLSVMFSGGGLTKTGPAPSFSPRPTPRTGATLISGGTLQLGTGLATQDGSLSSGTITDNSVLVYDLNGTRSIPASSRAAGP